MMSIKDSFMVIKYMKLRDNVPDLVLRSGSAGIDLTWNPSLEAIQEIRERSIDNKYFIGRNEQSVWVDDGDRPIFETGIAVEIPENHFGLLTVRSSTAKLGFSATNGVGIIDSDYRGEIKMVLQYSGVGCTDSDRGRLVVGNRYLQLVIIPCLMINSATVSSQDFSLEEVKQLSDTARGAGGFGSTGK